MRAQRIRLLCAMALVSRFARAESGDSSTAEALFIAGRSALERGDVATACARFEESYKLDPANGTLVNLATCEEDLNRLARAWAHFRQLAETLPKDDDRRPLVKEHLGALDRRIPWLTVRLEGAPPGTSLSRDGVPVAPATWGVAFPVDPGRHHLAVAAPGHEPKTVDIDIGEAERHSVMLEPGPAIAPSRVAESTVSEANWPRRAGYVSLGVSAGALVAAGVSGAFLLRERSTVDDHCPTRATCDDMGLRAAGMANVLQATAVAAAAVSVVAAGIGIPLLTWKHSSSPGSTASVFVLPRGVAARMTF